ncbi:Bug family tripartite tricarboxylate transporter substrate binding protein [Falsiroseomonas tokyonensis]|uniref:Bug family tripartite tricarboxylate transporter substrate binding protein n=1 Tax=Falsiroseomonas tokyonensis TaxID=430521 RepID=A0ABV7BW86_9PROT|nr:tripartite tricarboxylate transporter substrate binding protein [Falsiroseomonas tokyonensis]MBU8539773.1 tripartite tricarboxylate transporter substrate binding protein [Falsiroseomonas tokyonensis]
MRPTRRALLAAAPALALATRAQAQAAWPQRSIRLIVPFSAGGAADSAARVITPHMGQKLGQNFVVENRTGASGSLGGAEIARATDGHSFLWDASSHLVNPALLRGLTFDYATAFTPISLVVAFPSAIAVKTDFPATTLAEFVAAAKARPGAITVGTQGNATAGHLGLVAFARRAGIEVIHVPYRGGAAAAQDLASGAIDAVFTTLVSAGPVVDAGRARFLAVGTLERVESRPDVPTIAESGHAGFESNEWAGLFGPAGTPPAVVQALSDALVEAVAVPAIRQRLVQIGCVPMATRPADFARFVSEGRASMATLVREANIRAE